jgi:hypothetical protein
VGEESSSSVAQISAALNSPLKANGLEFVETPLDQAVSLLQDEYSIPIQLDLAALLDAGINSGEPVTVNVRGISLKSALRLMLKPRQLTYIVQDEVLMITTPEEAERHLVICVYDVRDLTNGGNDAEGVESLVDAVTSCVASESWAENGGGQAVIHPLKPGLLVVTQVQAVQEQVRDLLDAVRRLTHEKPGAAK